tara:strand:+ start:2137 stop:4053 length:1917 start_codon:yes stop_codon:yes gene_type:complete
MALKKLALAPGLNREGTNYSNEGGWYDGDKIRFRSGNPEKIGGWVRLSDNTYLGLARSLWNWIDLNGTNYLGVGTNLKYYIEKGAIYYDITPLRVIYVAPATTNCFATTNLLYTVVVTIVAHGAIQNDFVTFSGAVAVGGITATTLNSEYQITYIDANSFSITSPTAATSSVAAGGGAGTVASFQITTGLDVYSSGVGWGAGGWGRGGWGTGVVNTIGMQLRLWSNDNYGQDLVFAPRGGAIYYWEAAGGVGLRAVTLSAVSTFYGYPGTYVPTTTNQILASSIQRFVIAFGANPYVSGTPASTFDPMLVRWSDQNNQYQWAPAITNQAGEFRLTHGSYIMSAQVARQETLIWTDSALYSMQYLGPPYVFNFQVLMDNISMISPNSAITVNNVTYWMGIDKFYFYDGTVHTLPCTLWQYVYEDLNLDQSFQVFAGGNNGYNEIWWFYCSEDTSVIDRYVIFNYLDQVWYSGTMGRTAWLDSGIRAYPIAANYENRLLYHEASVDDVSGLFPVPIPAYVQSSDFDIEDGQNFGFVWRILPDINFNGSSVNNPYVTMTVVPRENSGASYGPADAPIVTSEDNYALPYPPNSSVYVIQTFTGQVYTRLRGRQMSFRIDSDGLGVAWQLGRPRIDLKPDGKR